MNDPDKPLDGTQPQSPADVARAQIRAPFQVGQPVPNREMWVLERELGVGGFGAVWLAKHEWKDERVAVKFCTHPAARHQLLTHEKKVVARVMRHGGDHPNVVPLLDCNLSGETPWLIYEYVAGGTLAAAVVSWKDVPLARRLARTVRVMHALASALGTFHRLDPPIVHRDMKPHNVLMTDGKIPRITDFGLGGAVLQGAMSESGDPQSGHSVALPSMLRAMGTVRYAPQEQMLGSPPSPRDDVYALGVIAYQLVTSNLKAVPGTDAQDELRKLRAPDALVSLVLKSVAMDPDRRPKDAGEWERKLAKLLPKPGAPLGPSIPPAAALPPPPAAPTPAAAREPTAVWNELGDRGQAEADFQTGENFYHGRGMPQDYTKARDWYMKAADRGHAGAQYNLGVMLYYGYGVAPDQDKARGWYELAAAQGHAVAQYNLGVISEHGRGAVQDHAKAREWYEKAGQRGHAAAQNNLGVMHEIGRGGLQDHVKAREWYEKAAAQGYPPACYNLAVLFDSGRGGVQDYTKAREWYEKAAALGHAKAQYNLGVMCDLGRGVRQDYAKARWWYEQAAAQGDAQAQTNLGVLHELGRGVPRNYEKAREWYEKAVERGQARAKAYLAELCENGLGGPQNLTRALELYAEAAKHGIEAAKRGLTRLSPRG